MAQNIFKGLGVALITPFKADGSVDYQSLKRLVEFQIDNGADFLCILATTGEAPCLTQEEKDKITELVLDVNKGRVKILKYCGGNNTAAVVEEIKNTNWKGIDGILSICPYYNKPSQEGLYQHFKAIAQVSPLPIVLYNVPGRTGVNMKPETTCRIACDFPNVVAVKEASGSLEQVDEIIKNKPDNFEVISGDDALCATRAAVEEGIVTGGGVAYIRAQKALEEMKGDNVDETTGINIIRRAIEEPLRQICRNAGIEGAVIVNKVREGEGYYGYNAKTEEFGDLRAAGVVDPAKVTRVALENAASVAGMFLTTECVICDKKEDKPEMPMANPGMGGMM